LYSAVRAPEFRAGGLDDIQIAALLDQQFKARSTHYESAYPEAGTDIILDGDTPIGSQIVSVTDEIRLIDIALLPEYRGQGIGTSLLEELLHQADEASKEVVLHVEQFNPAYRLYERFGFKTEELVGVYWRMRRAPRSNQQGRPHRKGR
jgi:ribosomal protein S18 acetylase RimI-like enzyme